MFMPKEANASVAHGDSACSISPTCLSSHFRLLQICEKSQRDGALDDIDALLGQFWCETVGSSVLLHGHCLLYDT